MTIQEVVEAVQRAIEEAGGPGIHVDELTDRIMQAVEAYADDKYQEGFCFGQELMANPL